MNEDVVRSLSPGVRELVVWLNKMGFETCDSGDGTNFASGMECAVPFPMVAMEVPPEKMQSEADRLMGLLAERGVNFLPQAKRVCNDEVDEDTLPVIQATYSPQDKHAIIVLYNVLSVDAKL